MTIDENCKPSIERSSDVQQFASIKRPLQMEETTSGLFKLPRRRTGIERQVDETEGLFGRHTASGAVREENKVIDSEPRQPAVMSAKPVLPSLLPIATDHDYTLDDW
jgi:hypothetical protein